MASSRRKSTAIALAVVGVAGLSVASAAQLNVDSSALGAANEVVAACQDAEIQIGFANQYDATLAGYETAAVTLSGVLATCAGQSIQVTLASEDGTALASGSATAAVGTNTVALSGAVDAESIDHVAVVIAG